MSDDWNLDDYLMDEHDNKEIVLAVVQKDGLLLEYASKELRRDKEVVLAAVRNNGLSLQSASKNLQGNKEVVVTAIMQNGRSLEYASKEFQGDSKMVMKAIECDKYYAHDWNGVRPRVAALQYASPIVRNDKHVVLTAVTKNGQNLQYASEGSRNDRDIVLTAIKTYGEALQFATDELLNDKEFIIAALQLDPESFRFVPQCLQKEKDVLLAAIRATTPKMRDISTLLLPFKDHIPSDFWTDRDFVRQVVQTSGSALEYVSSSSYLLRDPCILLAALRTFPWALSYAPEELRANKSFVLQAVQVDGRCLRDASEDLRADEEIVLTAVQQYGRSLKYASRELRDTKHVVLAALRIDGNAMVFVSPNLRKDIDVAVTGVLQNAHRAIQYLPPDLLEQPSMELACRGIRDPLRRKDPNRIPHGLWSNILSLASRRVVYYYLTNKPELVQDTTTRTASKSIPPLSLDLANRTCRMKRKIGEISMTTDRI